MAFERIGIPPASVGQNYYDGSWSYGWCYWLAVDPTACYAAVDSLSLPGLRPVPAPPAPKTRQDQTTWTPERMLEQYRRDTEEWARDPFAEDDGSEPPKPPDKWPWWVKPAAAIAGALLLVRVLKG